jgi:hypothetical protein
MGALQLVHFMAESVQVWQLVSQGWQVELPEKKYWLEFWHWQVEAAGLNTNPG